MELLEELGEIHPSVLDPNGWQVVTPQASRSVLQENLEALRRLDCAVK